MDKKISLLRIYLLSALILIGVFLWRFKRLPPQIPLYYSRSSGEENLTSSYMIFIIPALMTGLIVINSLISKRNYADTEVMQNIFYVVDICLILFSLFIFLRIVFLIT